MKHETEDVFQSYYGRQSTKFDTRRQAPRLPDWPATLMLCPGSQRCLLKRLLSMGFCVATGCTESSVVFAGQVFPAGCNESLLKVNNAVNESLSKR